jgi:hypothetical protein
VPRDVCQRPNGGRPGDLPGGLAAASAAPPPSPSPTIRLRKMVEGQQAPPSPASSGGRTRYPATKGVRHAQGAARREWTRKDDLISVTLANYRDATASLSSFSLHPEQSNHTHGLTDHSFKFKFASMKNSKINMWIFTRYVFTFPTTSDRK